jgi:hypothetical protein
MNWICFRTGTMGSVVVFLRSRGAFAIGSSWRCSSWYSCAPRIASMLTFFSGFCVDLILVREGLLVVPEHFGEALVLAAVEGLVQLLGVVLLVVAVGVDAAAAVLQSVLHYE